MLKLTYNQTISINCPSGRCNAKAGEGCNMKGDILMVKQFDNVHFNRQGAARKLLYGNKTANEPPKEQLINRNGILRREVIGYVKD